MTDQDVESPRWRRRLALVRRIWVRTGLVITLLMPVAAWATFRAQGLPEGVLASTDALEVRPSDQAIWFVPRPARRAGLLLLGGCPVEPAAYAPLVRAVAERGYLGAIVKVPWRCAPFPGDEEEAMARVGRLAAGAPDIERWLLAAHSRGALPAIRLALNPPARVEALALLGTTHPRELDLSASPLEVTKIFGTRDGVAPVDRTLAARPRLPASTRWVRIEGGNHSQFGYYGFQFNDDGATISREAQHEQVVGALVEALERLEPPG